MDEDNTSNEENVKRFKKDHGDRNELVGALDECSGGPTGGPAGDNVQFNPSPNTRNRSYRTRNEHDDESNDTQANLTENPSQEVEPVAIAEEPQIGDIEEPSQSGGIDDEEEADHEESDDHDEWYDYNSDDDNEDEDIDGDDLFSDDDSHDHLFSDNGSHDFSNSSNSDEFDNDDDMKEHPLFKKQQPKHTWHAVSEVSKRQLGSSSNIQSRELFQRRCYGSLRCVRRLELMSKLEAHYGCVNSLNFHPDGSLLASGSDDLKVVVWDWKINKCLLKYKTKHRENVFQSKFLHLSGDIHIATCARDGQVRLAQLNKEEGVKNTRLLGTHKGPCHKLIVLPEQPQIVISVGEDGVVLRHDLRDTKSTKLVTLKNNSLPVPLYSIHGHPLKSEEFCVSGRDSLVRVYDQRKNKPLATYTPFKPCKNNTIRDYHVTCAVYNHLGNEILASYSESDIFLFDTKDTEPGHYIKQYQGHKNAATIKGVNFFGPKSEFIVSGSDCGHIYFWHRETEALVQWMLGDDHGVVNCLEPHPQLPFLATSGLDHDVKVWVPSNEEDPKMDGLTKTVRNNFRNKGDVEPSDPNETQMLWMLWRHLRRTNRNSNSFGLGADSFSDSNSSETDIIDDSSNDSDEGGHVSQCRAS